MQIRRPNTRPSLAELHRKELHSMCHDLQIRALVRERQEEQRPPSQTSGKTSR